MGAIVETAVCGAVWKVIFFLMILPMGVLLLGYLLYILAGVIGELHKK